MACIVQVNKSRIGVPILGRGGSVPGSRDPGTSPCLDQAIQRVANALCRLQITQCCTGIDNFLPILKATQADLIQNELNNLSHGQDSNRNMDRYKTEMCRNFQESGSCKFGERCWFAHGHQDLHSTVRHHKYKTQLCQEFHVTGVCHFGTRCHFIQEDKVSRQHVTSSCGSSSESVQEFEMMSVSSGSTSSSVCSSSPPLSPRIYSPHLLSPSPSLTSLSSSSSFEFL